MEDCAPFHITQRATEPETKDCQIEPLPCMNFLPVTPECEQAMSVSVALQCGGIIPTTFPSVGSGPNDIARRASEPETKECKVEPISCMNFLPVTVECEQAMSVSAAIQCGGIIPTTLAPVGSSLAVEADNCECEEYLCSQSWPESCYCAKAAEDACAMKCPGKKSVRVSFFFPLYPYCYNSQN